MSWNAGQINAGSLFGKVQLNVALPPVFNNYNTLAWSVVGVSPSYER